MFHSARLKLTGWYLFIIMLISILFSMAIYSNVSRQIEGFIRMQNERIRNFQERPRQNGFPEPPAVSPPMISAEELRKQEQQLLYSLLLINLGILIITGGAGYLLAGRTLRPIKLMIDEQNQFISDASHELRTPIATLQAEMEGMLLEKKIPDKKARILIKSNLEEVGVLKKLTNSLLQLTKIHYFNDNYQTENLSLPEVIESAKNRVSSLAKKKKIAINIKIPEVIVKGNNDALTEFFLILFENAIKYSPQNSKVTVVGKKLPHMVKVFVSDKGVGISKEDLPYIFERFYRADKSRSLTEGFGLGLSIAKKIIDFHKGTIKVKSTVNEGSTFIIELPLANS